MGYLLESVLEVIWSNSRVLPLARRLSRTTTPVKELVAINCGRYMWCKFTIDKLAIGDSNLQKLRFDSYRKSMTTSHYNR